MRQPRPLESAVQQTIVDYLRAVLLPSYRVFAVPNASHRTKNGRASNGVPGFVKGIPDLVIVGQGRGYFLEVKSDEKATLSDEQNEFACWCCGPGIMPWARVESIEHVRTALSAWKVPTREAQ